MRLALVHWNTSEGELRARELRNAGFEVDYRGALSPPDLRHIRESPPDAVVIDLTRLPSQGREVAVMLRQGKATRGVPLVFAGGPPEKVALIRDRLPDAVYSEWDSIATAIRLALKTRPRNPVVPPRLEGYTQSPLPKKLGIKPGCTVALVNAPAGFEALLETADALLRSGLRGKCDLTLLFVQSQAEMEAQFERAVAATGGNGPLWVVYPKKSSGVRSDLKENTVREFGIALGMVDFKVCAVDATWTGLCFARRKNTR